MGDTYCFVGNTFVLWDICCFVGHILFCGTHIVLWDTPIVWALILKVVTRSGNHFSLFHASLVFGHVIYTRTVSSVVRRVFRKKRFLRFIITLSIAVVPDAQAGVHIKRRVRGDDDALKKATNHFSNFEESLSLFLDLCLFAFCASSMRSCFHYDGYFTPKHNNSK